MSDTTSVMFFGKKKRIPSDCPGGEFKHGKMEVEICEDGEGGYFARAVVGYSNGFGCDCEAGGKTEQKAVTKLEQKLIKGIAGLQKFLG